MHGTLDMNGTLSLLCQAINLVVALTFTSLFFSFRGVRKWYQNMGPDWKLGLTFGFICFVIGIWVIHPTGHIGRSLVDTGVFSTNLWQYYWADWGTRFALMIVDALPIVGITVIGVVWPIHYIPNGGPLIVVWGIVAILVWLSCGSWIYFLGREIVLG